MLQTRLLQVARPKHLQPAALRWLRAGWLAGALGLSGGAHAAIAVSVTDPSPTLLASSATCTGFVDGKAYKDCSVTASVSTTPIGGADAEFLKSFSAWNASLPAATKWTLTDAGLLPGGSLKVSTFDASFGSSVGRLEINIEWDYAGLTKDLYYWAQGLRDNYTTSPAAIVPLFYEMDNLGSTTSPLYPFQYADKHFYDKPAAPLPNGSFSARAMLVRVDPTFRTLTTYEGVAYDVTLAAVQVVPEPAMLALWLVGLAGVGVSIRRARGAG